MTIKQFLDNKPTVHQILEFVEAEAQKIVSERKKERTRSTK